MRKTKLPVLAMLLFFSLILVFSGCLQKKETKASPTPSQTPNIEDSKPFIPRQTPGSKDTQKKLTKPYDCSDIYLIEETRKKFGPGFSIAKETPRIGVTIRRCVVSKGNSNLMNFFILEHSKESNATDYFENKKYTLSNYLGNPTSTNLGFGTKSALFTKQTQTTEYNLFFIDDSEKNVYIEINAFGTEQKDFAIEFAKMLEKII